MGPGSRGEGEADLSGMLSDFGDPGLGLSVFGGLSGELRAVPRPGLWLSDVGRAVGLGKRVTLEVLWD